MKPSFLRGKVSWKCLWLYPLPSGRPVNGVIVPDFLIKWNFGKKAYFIIFSESLS